MTNEIRQARLAGLLPKINFTEFAVLLIMADTCRGDSRFASISMSELVKLSGQERTSMWRAVNKLDALGYVRKVGRGNQFQASSYELLPDARCADATSTDDVACCVDATSNPGARCADATSTKGEHVALTQEHVAFESGARCADATHPEYPDINPEGELLQSGTSPDDSASDPNAPSLQQSANGSGKRLRCARHAHIVNDHDVPSCPGCRDVRLADGAAQRQAAEQLAAERARIRQLINDCPDCDLWGRIDVGDAVAYCAKHLNLASTAVTT